MKASVSSIALALCLAACATTSADTTTDVEAAPGTTVDLSPAAEPARATVEEAKAFVAAAEKDLAEFSVINSRAQWVNATYITDDTDALGTIDTMNVAITTDQRICTR